MMKSIKTICFVGATVFLTACGWHFDNGAAVPAELKTMALESSDPYSEMSMAMRKQLLSNNVNLVPAKQGVPVLRLNKQTTWPFFTFPFSLPDVADQKLYEQRKASLHLAFTICRDALYI
ncbi:MAG: hypothetical protein ACFNX3_06795 [Haemophilus parainfluenzae]